MTSQSHTRENLADLLCNPAYAAWFVMGGAMGLAASLGFDFEFPFKLVMAGFFTILLGWGVFGFLDECDVTDHAMLTTWASMLVMVAGAGLCVWGLVGLFMTHVHVTFS